MRRTEMWEIKTPCFLFFIPLSFFLFMVSCKKNRHFLYKRRLSYKEISVFFTRDKEEGQPGSITVRPYCPIVWEAKL